MLAWIATLAVVAVASCAGTWAVLRGQMIAAADRLARSREENRDAFKEIERLRGECQNANARANGWAYQANLYKIDLEKARTRGRQESEEDYRLKALAESAVRELYGSVFHDDGGMWLRDTYRVHRKDGKWIVEGITIDGNTSSAEACFWSVMIADDAEGPLQQFHHEYEAKVVVFNLRVHERTPGGNWVDKGKITLKEPYTYPKLNFD